MRFSSAAASLLLLSACATTPAATTFRKVSASEIPDYKEIVSSRPEGRYVSFWVQAGNKTEECKLLMEGYAFEEGEEEERIDPEHLNWDGECKDGKTHGLGKMSVNSGSVEWFEIAFHNHGITDRHFYRGVVGDDRVMFGSYLREEGRSSRSLMVSAALDSDGAPSHTACELEINHKVDVARGVCWAGQEQRSGIFWDDDFFGITSYFDNDRQQFTITAGGPLNVRTGRPTGYSYLSNREGTWHHYSEGGRVREYVELPESYIDAIVAASDEAMSTRSRVVEAGRIALLMKKNYEATRAGAEHPSNSAPALSSTPEGQPPRPLGTGTAFFVSDDGYLVTNSHVVHGATKLWVVVDGRNIAATLVEEDTVNDIALLKVDTSTRALPLALGGSTKPGADVTVLGYPRVDVQGPAQKATFGHINADSGASGDVRYFQVSAAIQPGNSGGPMLDEAGAVIGIVSKSLAGMLVQNVNYAVKIAYALPLLISHNVEYKIASRGPALSRTDLVEGASKSVVLILAE